MAAHKALPSVIFIAALCVALLAGCACGVTLSTPLLSSTPPSTSPVSTISTTPPASTAPPSTTSTSTPTTTATPTPTINNLLAPFPLSDMTAYDRYKGEDGGLYGSGMNAPLPVHYAAALAELAKIKPLDASGNPSPGGKVVLISIGMSNTTMEFGLFRQLANADPLKSPNLIIVDGAQGGQTAKAWATAATPPDTQNNPWQVLADRLYKAGVTPAQVQVVWIKEADAGPTKPFPVEAQTLQSELATIAQRLKQVYPNIRIAYLSSRIYAGYATTALNPEPYAYEGAFAVRWLIQKQISGDAGLNYNASVGAVNSPLLLWGPYLWADGMNPRSDGLIWERGDLSPTDGTHPSRSGELKVANMLLDFFKTNELARGWFTKPA